MKLPGFGFLFVDSSGESILIQPRQQCLVISKNPIQSIPIILLHKLLEGTLIKYTELHCEFQITSMLSSNNNNNKKKKNTLTKTTHFYEEITQTPTARKNILNTIRNIYQTKMFGNLIETFRVNNTKRATFWSFGILWSQTAFDRKIQYQLSSSAVESRFTPYQIVGFN